MKKHIPLIALLLFSLTLNSQEDNRFVDVTNVSSNSEYSDFGVTFYKNDMVLFASARKDPNEKLKDRKRNRMQHLQFYKGLIGTSGDIVFGGKYSMDEHNMFYESDITFTPDGKTIYFTLNNFIDDEYAKEFRKGDADQHILNLYKASVDDAGIVSNIEELPFNDPDFSMRNPRLSPDGKTLYFASDIEGGFGQNDIYKVAIHSDGTYGILENLGPNINTDGNELFPFLSTNNIFYYTTDGRTSSGYLDVFKSEYSNGTYTRARPVKGINSEYDDFGFVISPEKGIGYFSSTRRGKGGADIYSFKIETQDCEQLIAGVLKDKNSNHEISGATVQLFSGDELVETITTNDTGIYAFSISCETSYKIIATKDEYSQEEKNFVTSNVSDLQESLDLFIAPIDCHQLIAGVVESEETKIPLLNVELALYYKNTLIERTYSQIGGIFEFNSFVGCNREYEIKAETINYLPTFTYVATTSEFDKKHHLKIKMEEFSDFITTRNITMIKTNPIHFDLNDMSITRDAGIELDKVVEVMKKNPDIKIEIGSHTDSRAPDAYNMTLSEDRAKSTIAYIVSKGIDPSRIYGQGYGESQPINKCTNGVKCSEVEHQANRRTEFIVVNE